MGPSRFCFLLVLAAGCAPEGVDLRIDTSACTCTPTWLELYLFRAGEGCARAYSAVQSRGSERVLSATGGDLVALVLAYARGSADGGVRSTFCGKDFTLPSGEAGMPDYLMSDRKIVKDAPSPPDGKVPPPGERTAYCGNKKCDPGETCKSCPGDCGGCPVSEARPSCICCYAASRLPVADGVLALRSSGLGCGVPGTALGQAGLPSSMSMPPSICP